MREEPEDIRLNQVLRAWRVDETPSPGLEREVWRRIERAGESRSAPGMALGLARLLEFILPQPKVAFTYVSALLLLGVAAGSWAAQVRSTHLELELKSRYVHSIDPYLTDVSPP